MNYNPDQRAKELHSKIGDTIKQELTTTAVGITENGIGIIGTSDRRFQKEIENNITENEILAESHLGNHAEENVINEADKRNFTIKEIGASRDICLDCEEIIKNKGILSLTPFSGKKSRNRKK
jgi:hypothetical protein